MNGMVPILQVAASGVCQTFAAYKQFMQKPAPQAKKYQRLVGVTMAIVLQGDLYSHVEPSLGVSGCALTRDQSNVKQH